MTKVTQIAVPQGSLLAGFGGPQDYRDCFSREVPGEVSLPQFIERFYSSMAFRPERVVLRLLGRGASRADIRALARGEADGIAVWKVVSREPTQILLESKGTGTASWLCVEPTETSSNSAAIGQRKNRTRLLFGSWVDDLANSGWRVMEKPHQWYSRVLLGGC